MAEEPEEMLPKQWLTTNFGPEKPGSQRLIEQQHDQRSGENRNRQ